MSNPFGQRESTALITLSVVIFSFLTGETPETAEELLTGAVAPLAIMLVTLAQYIQIIQSRVEAGEIQPGNLVEILFKRETFYAVSVLIAGGISVAGKQVLQVDIDSETHQLLIDAVWNVGMVIGTLLLRSLNERPSGAVLGETKVAPDTTSAVYTTAILG